MKLLVFGAMFLALNLFTFALSVVNLVKGGDIISIITLACGAGGIVIFQCLVISELLKRYLKK